MKELQQKLNSKFMFPLNLQLFAEGGDDGAGGDDGNDPTPPNEPQETMIPKSQLDKVMKELAAKNKMIKDSETESQRIAREQQEKDAQLQELTSFKNKSILEKGLLTNGLDANSVDKISEAIISGDMESIAKVFGEVYKNGTSNLQKEIDALKLSQIDKPNGSDGDKEVTLEDYKKMTLDEQIRLKNSNPELFKTLNSQMPKSNF